jgi:molybdopterin synthase sulfur carrier subunit
MKVKVKFFASAREITGAREETIEITDSTSVTDFLRLLTRKHGDKLKEYLFDPKTDIPRAYLQFLVNDRPIHMLQGLSTVLADGCVFTILPPATGG